MDNQQFKLEILPVSDKDTFIAEAQAAFQKGFEDHYGKTDSLILPLSDIEGSFKSKGAIAYKATLDGKMMGGAIIVVKPESSYGHLDLLYVKTETQGIGVGKRIWQEIECLHPEIKIWETCTPYFDKRNIHFYVNVCKFHIVEFFNSHHPEPGMPDNFIGDGGEGMFHFRKELLIVPNAE